MKKSIGILALAALLVCSLLTDATADTSLRCGNKLIDIGDTMYFVRQVCGEPTSEQRVGERTTYSILAGEQYKIKDQTYIFEWIYPKDAGFYILTFEGSRLIKKEYER